MNEINEKMTALADEIRELSGTTTKKGLDAMTSDVNVANTEINEQTDLISQIVSALDGKASGSGCEDVTAETNTYTSLNAELEEVINSLPNAGGGSGGSVEMVTGEIISDMLPSEDGTIRYLDENLSLQTIPFKNVSYSFRPIKNSIFSISIYQTPVNWSGVTPVAFNSGVYVFIANEDGFTITFSQGGAT